MKCFRLLLLAACCLPFSAVFAQSGLGMLPSASGSPNTVIVGSTANISALVQNQDVDSNFFSVLTVTAALSNGGGMLPLQTQTQQQVFLSPFDTVPVSFAIDFTPANGFVLGNNCIYIWAESQGFATNDTLVVCVTVIPNPVQLLMVESGGNLYPDTVERNSNFSYLFRVVNGSNYTIDALPKMYLGVESNSFAVLDSTDWGGTLSLAPGDSAQNLFPVQFTYANGFDDGGNIVVIWPEAPPGTAVDSLRIPVQVVLDLYAADVRPTGLEYMRLFPNPAVSTVSFKSKSGIQRAESVLVTDLTGRELARFVNVASIDLGHLPGGVYFVKAQFAHEVEETFRLLKQ